MNQNQTTKSKKKEKQSNSLCGVWYDDNKYSGAKYTIKKENGKIFLYRKFNMDGNIAKTEMAINEKSYETEVYYKYNKDKTSAGDYYTVGAFGNVLCIYDNQGLVKRIYAVK